ncbi:MAG: HIT domain-containing protein [Candidatus Eisenbacteria bacterium]
MARPRIARGTRVKRASGLARLWAPWRMTYVAKADEPTGCLFCRVGKGAKASDRRDLVLARGGTAILMLNRYPYTPAHLMVALNRHAAQFRELSPQERLDLLDLTALAESALELEYQPHGVNYGLNVGRVAGAGFPGHLHLHLVPRWNGDTNFMATVGETRVLPESLLATWTRLRKAIATLQALTHASPAPRRPAVGRSSARGTNRVRRGA